MPDLNKEKEKRPETLPHGEVIYEAPKIKEEPEGIRKSVKESAGEVLLTHDEAMQRLTGSQNRIIEQISEKEPWELTKALQAARMHSETAKTMRERLKDEREKQRIAYERANAADIEETGEMRIRQAERKADEAKQKARTWFRWISGPLSALGEGIADVLKGIGEGAGKLLAGFWYGILERRAEHKRKKLERKLK
jgi:hypothetical protein